MRAAALALSLVVFVMSSAIGHAQEQKPLEVYFVDVEGGQATLLVSPSGESLLIDAGFPGARDADRITAAAEDAGVTQIDYFLNTHFHGDHFGSIPDLVMRIPIRNFVDSGTISEASERAVASFQTYAKVRATGHHIVAKPGDTVPITGIDVQVVTSGGAAITRPLAGAGAPNPLCGDITLQEVDTSEDARSVGIVIRLGSFRMIDLGDLTWNKENELACPNNLVGTVDLYLATRHGLNGAGLPALVQGLKPRVSVINNGGTKGASPEHFLTIKNSPGLEDIWQLHYSMPRAGIPRLHETSRPGGPDLNTSEPLIANLDDTTAHYLKLTARADGSFVLLNPRNGHTKEYLRRP